jgi:hypothetical protein
MPQELFGTSFHQGAITAAFHVQSDNWLGVRHTEVETPVAVLNTQTIAMLNP